METWGAHGLWGVFAVAFLAGSVIPAPSEAAVVTAIALGYPAWLTALVATSGNLAGAVSTFTLTRWVAGPGGERVESFLARRTKKDRARVERALDGIRRYGAPALLLSWVPIVGDPLVAAAGLARVGWLPFLVFVAVGKAARYAMVAAGAAAVATVLR
jgi:membrane protein YqaA with SNARE-associated domain